MASSVLSCNRFWGGHLNGYGLIVREFPDLTGLLRSDFGGHVVLVYPVTGETTICDLRIVAKGVGLIRNGNT